MKRLSLLLGFWLWFLVAAQPASASNPVIVGEISGVEVCAQFLQCNAAVFTGTCDCEIDSRNTPGFFWVSVQHDPLPAPLHSSAILGGKWNLSTLRGSFSGKLSTEASSTMEIIRSQSLLDSVCKKVATAMQSLRAYSTIPSSRPLSRETLCSHKSELFCSPRIRTPLERQLVAA